MKTRKITRYIIAVLCFVSLMGVVLAGASANESTLDKVLEQGYITVGVSGTFPPFGFIDQKTGKSVGFDIEMARLIAYATWFEGQPFDEVKDQLDSRIRYVVQPEASRIPNLLAGKVDVVIQGMTQTPARAQMIEFTKPYYIEHGGLIGKPGVFIPESSYSELEGRKPRIAVLQNPFAEAMAKNFASDAIVMQFPNTSDGLLAVETGQAEYFSSDWSTIAYIMAEQPGKWVRGPRAPGINRQNYSMAVKPGDQRWLNYLNLIITEMQTATLREQYEAAYEQWFFESPEWGYPELVSPYDKK